VEVVASLSQSRTAAAQCGLFTHKSVPIIFEPPCISLHRREPYNKTNSLFKHNYICWWSLPIYRLKTQCDVLCQNNSFSWYPTTMSHKTSVRLPWIHFKAWAWRSRLAW